MHKVKGSTSFTGNLVRHGWDTRKTSILNKLIHKPQAIHGGQRVCEENKLEELLEKKTTAS